MLIALIITIGLVPAMVSLWLGLRSHSHFRDSLHLAADRAAHERFRRFSIRPRDPDEHFVEGVGLVIGDITCQLNARSSYIRCAPNPTGPCEGCRDYEGKDYPPISTT
ncbi:MAG: DUF6464 family protein [Phormidesmis sp.]